MNTKTIYCALAFALATACSPAAVADEVRLFATASFGDSESGFGSAEYGWGSGNSIFTLGASFFVAEGPGEIIDLPNGESFIEPGDTEFKVGLNVGYTYLFSPEGSTGFVESRLGSLDASEFSDSAYYEASVGYRWYLSDRAAIGWNILGYEQRKSPTVDAAGNAGSDWNGNAFTRMQLIIALD